MVAFITPQAHGNPSDAKHLRLICNASLFKRNVHIVSKLLLIKRGMPFIVSNTNSNIYDRRIMFLCIVYVLYGKLVFFS
jgi:hypothetical protein